MNWKLWLLGLALVAAAVVGWMVLGPSEGKPLEVTILHTNDVHAHYEPFGDPSQGGAARLATAIEAVRAKQDHVLLLDAGDQFQGTLYFTVGGADVVAAVMNELGYDAMCIGNHEFDEGPAELARFIDLADFPVLSANIDALADSSLTDKILPFALFYFDGQPIAVIGLTTESTAISSSPGPNVQFLNAIEIAQRTAKELESTGVNKIIALTHLGYDRDLELAQAVQGIDVIVGGHSHTQLADYPTVTQSSTGEPVLIVTAYEWGEELGRLDVTFNDDGIITDYSGAPIPIDGTLAEDPAVSDILAAYRGDIDALMSKTVGTTDVSLNGVREDVRARETNLGDLICDAMLWKTQAFGTTIAIQNGGGIRASIPAGPITMGQVLEVLPYGNQIAVLTVSGAQLHAAIDNGVSGVQDGAGRFPQVGGLRVTFDPTADADAHVTSIETWDSDSGTYVPLNLEGTYVVATNSFLADGGDGYVMFADAQQEYDSYQTGWLLSDTLAEYLGQFPSIAPETEGRIVQPESGAE